MSIGICDLRTAAKVRSLGLAAVCTLSLGACVDGGGGGFSFAPKSAAQAESEQIGPAVPKSTKTTLARGTITLKAPKGYCIDESTVSNGLQGSSAMLAKCSALDGKGSGADTAVMSVSVSPRRGAAAPAPTLNDLVQAAAPRKVLQQTQKGNLALIQIATGGDDVFSPADPVHWRGATALDTRLVILALYAPVGSDLVKAKGASLLATLARGISVKRGSLLSAKATATPATGPQANTFQPEVAPVNLGTDTVEPEKKGAGGFIARLLNRS